MTGHFIKQPWYIRVKFQQVTENNFDQVRGDEVAGDVISRSGGTARWPWQHRRHVHRYWSPTWDAQAPNPRPAPDGLPLLVGTLMAKVVGEGPGQTNCSTGSSEAVT